MSSSPSATASCFRWWASVVSIRALVDLIPRGWITDERTRVLRRLTSRRAQLVRYRTRVKNEVAAVLVRNLKGRPPVTDVFGKRARRWLGDQPTGYRMCWIDCWASRRRCSEVRQRCPQLRRWSTGRIEEIARGCWRNATNGGVGAKLRNSAAGRLCSKPPDTPNPPLSLAFRAANGGVRPAGIRGLGYVIHRWVGASVLAGSAYRLWQGSRSWTSRVLPATSRFPGLVSAGWWW
jgi:hypothetical protein